MHNHRLHATRKNFIKQRLVKVFDQLVDISFKRLLETHVVPIASMYP